MGTVGDGDKFDGDGWVWGRKHVPAQLSKAYTRCGDTHVLYRWTVVQLQYRAQSPDRRLVPVSLAAIRPLKPEFHYADFPVMSATNP